MRWTLVLVACACLGLFLATGRAEAQQPPGAPTLGSVTAGTNTLTISWSAPAESGGTPITSYDLRVILSSATERADADWIVHDPVWETDGGVLRYVLADLLDGAGYDVQVRAVNADGADGEGPWSVKATRSTTDHVNFAGAESTLLALGSSLPGRIGSAGDTDFFRIQVEEAGELLLYTSGELNTKGTLDKSTRLVIATNEDGHIAHGTRNFWIRTDVQPGVHYVVVEADGGATGNYRLHASMVTAPSTTFGGAQTIALGVPTPGRINSSGDSNYFKFELDQAADVAIMASATSRVVGELLDSDESVLQTHSGGFLDQPGFVLRGQLAAGIYYIHVSLSAVGNVPFAVLVTEASSPGSTSATALRLPLFAPETGRLTSSTDQEYFRFTLAEAAAVSIRAQPFGDPFTLEPTLLDDQDTMLEPYVIPRAAYAEDGQPFSFGIVETLAAGTYYLKVAPATGESGGPYLISIQVDRDYEALLQRCTNLTSPQSDPLYGCQSHLKHTGRFGGARYDINVEPAWATTKGEGVNVAIVDRGIHAAHEDLVDNVLAGRNHDYYARDFLGVDGHGTAVAGLIAARDNDIGVRGVAPRATIYSYNLTARANFSANDEADAMTRNMVETAVSNNSWGYPDTGQFRAASETWEAAVERGVTEGFGGKGVFYAFAGGDGREVGDYSNLDGRANYYAVTAVCAVTANGDQADFSEEGANLWVCAPGYGDTFDQPGLATTTNGHRYTDTFVGTAGATAIVSGVAALVRAANTDLTWRDVKLILAASATRTDPRDDGWQQGSPKYNNPGQRYWFNHEYGFGGVNAGAAVALASGWERVPAQRTLEITANLGRLAIPDAPSVTDAGPPVSSSLTLEGGYIRFVEFMEISVTLDHPSVRDLSIELQSPSGVVSWLTIPLTLDQSATNKQADGIPLRGSFRFGSATHLGERAGGEWTLRIRDHLISSRAGTLGSWKLKAYGHGLGPGYPAITSATAGVQMLTIGWSAPDDTRGPAITSYDLRYIPSNATAKEDPDNWTVRTGIATTDAGTYSLTGLLRNGAYDLQVRAVNDAGPGPWSDSFTQGVQEEAPLVPEAPTLSPRVRALAAIWTPNPIDGGSDRYNYDLRYMGSNATDEDDDDNWTVVTRAWRPSRPIYTISGLTDGVSYDVQMRAINLVGTTAWSAASVGTPGPQNTDAAFPGDIDTARTVVENTPPGQKIGEPFTATDINGDRLTYFLDDPGSPFDIEPTTGQLLTKAPLNYEHTSTYLVVVLVRDDKDANGDHYPVSDDRLGANITIEDVNEAPVVTGPRFVAKVENTSTFVAAYQARDQDGDAHTWSHRGADFDYFEIDLSGNLRFSSPPDFEERSDRFYRITVVASDGTLEGTHDVIVRIDGINEPPVIDGPAEVSFEESRTGLVAGYTTTDPEERTTVWGLEGNDARDFDFDDGELSFKMPPDFEAPADGTGDNAYKLIVISTDGENRAEFPVTVMVTNKDEPGELTLFSQQPIIGFGLRATLTDPDIVEPGTVWTWARSRSGSSNWRAIDEATELDYAPVAADRDHYLRATASYTDGHGPNKRAEAVSEFQTKPDPGANTEPFFPVVPAGDRDLDVPEDTLPGTPVGDPVQASDGDGHPLTYILTGADGFVIDGETGQIRVADGMLDFTMAAVYSATVTATDPLYASAFVQFQITITDVNEAPVARDDAATTDEDEAVVVRVVDNDRDPETDDLEVMSVTVPQNGVAEVDAGGETITYTPRQDHHGADSFAYTVSDGHLDDQARVSVTVRPLNDAPAFAAATAERSVSENAPPGAKVGFPVIATDVDDDPLTYGLTGAAALGFEIDEHTGQITVAEGAAPNAAQSPYSVTVTARDPDGAPATVEVTITVTAGPVLPPVIVITGPGGGGGGGGGGGPSGPPPSEVDFEWTVTRDIEELDGGNDRATGVWSDGTTLWVADNADGAGDAVYAYDRASGERLTEREFTLAETNRAPRGFWSDRSVVWVSDSGRERLFAYRLADGERLEEREFGLPRENHDARGIWSDEETMWVLDGRAATLFAYDFESGELLAEYELDAANGDPRGIWSDGVTIWVSDHGAKRLIAYRLPAPEGPAAEDAEPQDLERVRDEEFSKLSRASNNSPRGIWSDGDVMYVADESDDRVYSYNMPDAIDARLASLTLSGVDIGEFDPGRRDYEAVVADGVTETTVEAAAVQDDAVVDIAPADADGEADGYQVALQDLGEITVTVTSADGSRMKTYRVRFPETGWDPARDPWPHCLRGAVSEGFSLVVYEGGSVEELVGCAESRDIVTLYALHEGVYVSHILGAPDFVNAGFVELFPDGLPPITPLIAASNGPPSADPFGDDLEGDEQQPWPECLRGPVAAGFSLVVYEGGSVDELEACAQSREIAALYALSEGEFVSYILGAPALVTQPFRDLFAGGLPLMTPLVARSEEAP